MTTFVVEFAWVSSPLWTVPKVPLPRNSPNCNCDGSIVVACGEILTPASNKCDDDDDDDDGVVGIEGTNPKADGRKMQNSIKTAMATNGAERCSEASIRNDELVNLHIHSMDTNSNGCMTFAEESWFC